MRSRTTGSGSLSAGAPSNRRDLEVLKHLPLRSGPVQAVFCAAGLVEDLARLRHTSTNAGRIPTCKLTEV